MDITESEMRNLCVSYLKSVIANEVVESEKILDLLASYNSDPEYFKMTTRRRIKLWLETREAKRAIEHAKDPKKPEDWSIFKDHSLGNLIDYQAEGLRQTI